MFSRLAFLLIVLSISFYSHAAFIQPLTRTPLRPFSVNRNYTTDYSFSFYIPTAIYFGAFIEVEFPLPYEISSACQAFLKVENSPIKQFSCDKTSSSTYLIDVGQILSGNYQLVLEGIKNPSAYSASSNLKLRTLFNKNIPVDANEYFDSIPFLSSPVISKNGLIVNQGYSGVNLGTRFDFTFTLTKGIKAGDSIKFNFPEGYYFVKPTCFHKNSGSYAEAEVLYNNRMLICQGFQYAMNASITQTVTIIGIVNPGHAGAFNGFSIESMQGISPNILERLSVQSTVLVQPGSVTVNIASESLYLIVNTTHQLNLLFENDVPAGSQIWIKIPPGFRYLAPNCTLIKTLDALSDSTVTCGLAANKTGYIIEGYKTISASQIVSVEINVENPPVSASYRIDVFSYSKQYEAKIDEGSGSITIGTIYGSSKYFASHSLKFTQRLQHGQTGALEFTFFLNVPLPATKSAFEGGKIVVDIRPPIPRPTTGNIVCFFYNTVPASTCEWDDSNADKTTITIGTPTTAPYFQTEIPITVTTQTDEGYYGITLPELIQRYKFYFYFYKNDETEFHEVYYEDYIPDPIVLPSSWYSAYIAPMQYNEEAYLRISFTNNYLALGTNYFFELGFDHGNQAWDYNLGWGIQEWYHTIDLPCIAENVGTAYKCTLKPGGAAGTGSLIQVIGLSEIALDQTFTLHFPKIMFGTSGIANMNFTLYQNTPGETTQKIPIVTTPISFEPNPAATLTTSAFNTLTVNPNRPDVDATLSFSFTSTADPEMTIYEYPNPFSLTSGTVDCGGTNTCYAFADPANWIVFFPNPLQGTTTSTSLTIRTAPYASTFGFSARTEKNGIVQDSRSSNFVLNPGPLTVTFIPSASNPEINSNSNVLFDLSFTTATHLPANASMNVVFTNLVVPDRDDFYCLVNTGLTGLDSRNVICQKTALRTIRIFNLAEVPLGTQISITFQLATAAATAVTARVTTYYEREQTFRVDTGLGSRTLTFLYDNFQNATIINDRSGQKVRVGETGLFTIQLTPTRTYTGTTLVVTFGNDFTLTAATDILLCRVNGIRRRCTFTTGPLTVTITNVARLNAGVQVPVTISSDFSSPFTKGIQAPSRAGWYSVNIAVGAGNTPSEQIGDFIYIYPISTPSFKVSAVPATAGEYAMYTFDITLNTTLASNLATTVIGKMFIDFPASNEGFAFDLGTGLNTGEYVGCNVQGLTNAENIHCKLWQSPGDGLPATVEVIGFDAITDPLNTAFTVRVARIRNPTVTQGEYEFTVRTQQVDLATNLVAPIEETTYSLWHQVITYVGTRPTYTAPNNPTFQAGAAPGQSGTTLNINIYDGRAMAANDYFIFEFPKDIIPDLTLTPPAGVSLALSFPDCNWVVYQLSAGLAAQTNRDGSVRTITIPGNLLPEGYNFMAYAWINNIFDNTVNYFIDPASYDTLTGNIADTALLVNQNELVRQRANTEFSVEFTPSVPIPAEGSIVIRFPAGFVPHPNCKNSPATGSLLVSSTGGIACTVSGTSWVITNFDEVAPLTPIKIYGMADLPNTAGNLGSVAIITYANQDADLPNNGQRIEISDNALPITIQNSLTLDLDVNPTTLVNTGITARTNNFNPLVVEFTTNTAQANAASTITLQVDGSAGGFQSTRATGEPTICYFVNIATEAITACTLTISTANNVISYAMQPLGALTGATNYKAVLTTAFAANGNDGVYFPTAARVYKANLIFAGTTTTETGMTFLEIVPPQFTSLTVKSYVITQGDENVIDIAFTAANAIPVAGRVIVELPTVFNNTALFEEDIGQGLYDGQTKDCDVVTSTPAGLTYSCFFQRGNQNAGTPASIVLYGFSAAFTQLRFAFTVNNPTLTTATIIPITVYSQTGITAFTKTNYQRVDEAIVVTNRAATVSNNAQNQPTYAVNTLATSTTLNANLLVTNAMQMSDYYVLKTAPMSATARGAFTTGTNLAGFGTSDILVLPRNQYIIIRPNAANVGAGTYTAAIPNIYTPDSAAPLTFSATLTLFSTMAGTQISYGTGAPLTVNTPITVTLDTQQVNRNSLMTITMNAVYQGIQSVIINVGNRIQVAADCYENVNSQIQVLQCTTDTVNNRVLITLEDNGYPTTARNLIVNVLSTNGGAAGAVNNFNFYYYTTVETNPTVATGQSNTFLNANPNVNLVANAPVGPEPNLLQFGYVPFRDDRDGIVNGDIGDLIVQATLTNALTAGDQVTIDLDNFDVAVTFIALGDVTSRAAVIMSSGNNVVQANAAIANNNQITFTIPAGTNFNAGATVSFRFTQIQRGGDFVGLTARTTTTDPLEVTMTTEDGNGNVIGTEASAQVTSFLTKSINNNNRVPLRLKFNLNNNIPANTGSVTLALPAGEYAYDVASNLVCYFRTYTTQLDYTENQAADCQVTGTSAGGLTITANPSTALAPNTLQELIVDTDSANPGFAQIASAGTFLTVSFSNAGGVVASSRPRIYQYENPQLVQITNFYYTSNYDDPNTIILQLTANAAIPAFPSSLIEFELTSASGPLIQNGQTAATRNIECGVVGLIARAASSSPLRCVIIDGTVPKVRIENYRGIANGAVFYLMLYDLDNTVIAQNFVGGFDGALITTNRNTNRQSQHRLTRMFLARAGSIANPGVTLNFPTSSSLVYNTATTLTENINWGAGDSCTTNCRLIVRGLDTDWTFPTGLQFGIGGTVQDVLVDTANNIFVVLQTNVPLTAGNNYAFTFGGMTTPTAYENNGGSIEIDFSTGLHLQRVYTLTGNYPNLVPAVSTTTTTAACTGFGTATTGTNGNIDCVINVRLGNTAVSAFFVDFTNPGAAQFSEVYPYCDAYISAGAATVTQGQLICSRQDTSGTNARFFITGFNFVGGSTISFTFRAKALQSTTITSRVTLQGINEGAYYDITRANAVALNIAGVLSTTAASPSVFTIRPYYEARVLASSSSPLRIGMDVNTALTATGSITATPTANFGLAANTFALCTLRNEGTFAAPFLTVCTYNTGTNAYTINMIDPIPVGRYLVKVTTLHQDQITAGVTFAANTQRTDLLVTQNSNAGTQVGTDSTPLAAAAPYFSVFTVNPLRNKIPLYNTHYGINLRVGTRVATDANSEAIVVFEFPNPLFDIDLGASTTTFAQDNLPYYNGMELPSSFTTFGAATKASLHYGDGTAPSKVVVSAFNAISAVQNSIASLSYLKNPAANRGFILKASVLQFAAGQYYPTVLYENTYTNYVNTITQVAELNRPLGLSFSTLYPYATSTMTISGKNYGTNIDTTSEIYIKLKDEAAGFDYESMTAVTCPGYTVDWHPEAYIFYLTPNGNLGTNTPTIVCNGFVIGMNSDEILVETGIYKDAYGRIVPSENTTPPEPKVTQLNDILTIDRIGVNVNNVRSVNFYRIQYNANGFKFPAETYIRITLPPILQIATGSSEYMSIYGFKDFDDGEGNRRSVDGITNVNDNTLTIRGYADYNPAIDGLITIYIFLRNAAAGTGTLSLSYYYQENDGLIISSAPSAALTVSATPSPVVAGSFSYATDTLPVYWTETYLLGFYLQPKLALSSANNDAFVITLPAGFAMPATDQLCRYSRDNGAHWIRSTGCTTAGQTVTVPLQAGFDTLAADVIQVLLTNDLATIKTTGLVRPSTPDLFTFNVKARISNQVQQSVFLPLVLSPQPGIVAATWYNRDISQQTVISVAFAVGAAIQATDFFQLELVTNDEIIQIFPDDLGLGSTEKRIMGNCARLPASNLISDNININCYITPGSGLAVPPLMAKVVIQNEKNIAAGANLRLFIAGVENSVATFPGGFVFSVMRPCRNDGLGCPIFRKRDYTPFVTSAAVTAAPMSVPTLTTNFDLFQTGVTTTFQLSLGNNLLTTDAIVIKTDIPNIILSSTCTSALGMCINFPALGWTFFQPTAALLAGTRNIPVVLDNGVFYDRTRTLLVEADVWNSGIVTQIFTSVHPNYQVMVPGLSTMMTQADPAIQRIVRNFDNIFELTMANIWRTALVQRILVNIPDSYATIDPNYCRAGCNLDDVSSPDYFEFSCRVTGDRQVLIVIEDTWTTTTADYSVVLYYKGFLPVNATTGQTSNSTITSFASMTLDWVVDENTAYSFFVDSVPTPIIRDLNLNLKSFYERRATINDYVEFYSAIWPYTVYYPNQPATQIKKMVFQVDDAYVYPTLSNLLCYMKVIYREQVNCTLQRTDGKTLINVQMPADYQNGPFLIRITNTQETLLFIAPDREGEFMLNMTMYNALGQIVEQDTSYMEIDGSVLTSFSAQPILLDPQTQTLYNVQFTTSSRVTPQGFSEDGQSVSTRIVLKFQNFDPAFPADLGTGLTNGSQISCVPVQGITVTQTGQLTCTLIYATTPDPILVIVTGYDAIPVQTDVTIYIDQIATLALNIQSRIKLEIQSLYSDSTNYYVFYDSTEIATNAPTASTARAPTTMTVTSTGSTTLKEKNTYTFTFTTSTALTANRDFIVIYFPDDGYELSGDYSGTIVAITTPSIAANGYIMSLRNVIYIQVAANLPAGAVTVTLTNLPNPSFMISGTLTYTAETIVNSKTTDVFNANVETSSVACTLFSNEHITYSSDYTRVNENTYQITFTVLHDVPATGSLAVLFDSSLYNLRPSDPQCEIIEGVSSAATCSFELFSQQLVRINLNGQKMTSGTQVKLNVMNVNNPTDSTTIPVLKIESFFDDSYDSTKIICAKDIPIPSFLPLALVECPVDITPEINNAGETTDYLVTISCTSSIRNATVITITFPSEFENRIPSDVSCMTSGNYILQDCSLIARTNQISVLISKPNVQQPIVIRIRDIQNPRFEGQYGPFSVQLTQYDVLYAQLDTTESSTSLTIASSGILANTPDILALSIFPQNFGEVATYYFSLVGLEFKQVPNKVLVDFDNSFASNLGSSLSCGVFTPQEQFGSSFALNYESLDNLITLPCSLIDDHVLSIQLTPKITLSADETQDFFFFVSNIVNPSLSQKTTTSNEFDFNLTFINDNTALLESFNRLEIDYGVPPSLLQISNFSSTDNNMYAMSNYTLSLSTVNNLPTSVDNNTKEYEVLFTLPNDQYPAYSNAAVDVSYSFPGHSSLESESSAFNYKNLVFINAEYPDLSTSSPFNITLYNMTNPSVTSECGVGATGMPVKFGAQYLNRELGFVYGRTYQAMDQGNCLALNKARDAINIFAPLYMRKGLIYTITIEIEEAASDLILTPISSFLIFEPRTINFEAYQTNQATIQVFVSEFISEGQYTIQWKKEETASFTKYMDVPDTIVNVVTEDTPTTLAPAPIVDVEDIRFVWTGRSARDVFVTLSQEPADGLTLQISSKLTDSKIQGSADGNVFTNFPITITFGPRETKKRFYIKAEFGAQNNALIYKLSGANALAFNQIIPNTAFIIKNYGSNNFQIFSTQQFSVSENMASYLVSLSDIGTIYYMAVATNINKPTLNNIVDATIPNIPSNYYNAGNLTIERIQDGSSISTFVNFTGLQSQTLYQVYIVARSYYGDYTPIVNMNLETSPMSEGVNLLIPTYGKIDVEDFLESLSIVLAIDQDRIIFNGAEIYPSNPTENPIGTQINEYRITIAPNPYNNTPTPNQIAQQLLTAAKQKELFDLVPEVFPQAKIRITPVQAIVPRFMVKPQVIGVGYYTLRIQVELVDNGRIYAIVTKRTDVGNTKPSSYQISNGLMANNVQVDERYFKKIVTNGNGIGEIIFDELNDYAEYNIYITAGNNVPYEPSNLMDDDDIVRIIARTNKNPNLGTEEESFELYKDFYGESSFAARPSIFYMFIIMLLSSIFYL